MRSRRGTEIAGVVATAIAIAACTGSAPEPNPDRSSTIPASIVEGAQGRVVWRAAHDLVGPDGKPGNGAPSWVVEGSPDADRGCIPQVLIKDLFGEDNSWPRDLPELVDRAKTVLFGTVTEVVPGFRFNRERGEAGTMLAVRIDERLRPDTEYAADTLLVFYPAGRFRVGDVEVCRLATSEMPDPPMVGDRILIAPRRAPIIADPAVFEPLVTGPEILYEDASGQLAVARGLAGLRELDAGLDFDQLRTKIRRLVPGRK